jgi:hypothetical protein
MTNNGDSLTHLALGSSEWWWWYDGDEKESAGAGASATASAVAHPNQEASSKQIERMSSGGRCRKLAVVWRPDDISIDICCSTDH